MAPRSHIARGETIVRTVYRSPSSITLRDTTDYTTHRHIYIRYTYRHKYTTLAYYSPLLNVPVFRNPHSVTDDLT